jgi:protein disulfide-isomerase A6
VKGGIDWFSMLCAQALVGLNSRRKVYSVLRGAFNNDGISEYIRDMAGGRGRITKYRGDSLPNVSTVEAWDGKDGEVSETN